MRFYAHFAPLEDKKYVSIQNELGEEYPVAPVEHPTYFTFSIGPFKLQAMRARATNYHAHGFEVRNMFVLPNCNVEIEWGKWDTTTDNATEEYYVLQDVRTPERGQTTYDVDP
jgi:hypothetical protein